MTGPAVQPGGRILVVGAGCTGLATALELRRQGVEVTLVDAAAQPQRESRGTGIQPRTLELLDLHALSDEIIAQGTRIEGLTSYQHGKEIGRIDFTLAPSRFAHAVALPQNLTEGVLRSRLMEMGTVPLWNHRLIDLTQTNDAVIATLETESGPIEIAADYLIGCDGARSAVRKLIDFTFGGKSFPEGWGLLDVTLNWDETPDQVRAYRLDGPEQFVVTPFGGTHYRVQINNRPEAIAHLPPTLEEMRATFTRYTGRPADISEPRWASAFIIHCRQVVAYRDRRVLLAGDAAHIHTPAGGQGLNTGIQDGFNLGWKLAFVVRGYATPRLLDTYEQERKPIAASVLELSETLALRPDAMLANSALTPLQVATRVSQLLVNYRDGPLGQAPRRPGCMTAGDRLPDVEIEGTSIYRAARSAGFVIVFFGGADDTAAAIDMMRHRFGDGHTFWSMSADSNLAQAIGGQPGALVIRPDGYLGLVAEGSSATTATQIENWLDLILGGGVSEGMAENE